MYYHQYELPCLNYRVSKQPISLSVSLNLSSYLYNQKYLYNSIDPKDYCIFINIKTIFFAICSYIILSEDQIKSLFSFNHNIPLNFKTISMPSSMNLSNIHFFYNKFTIINRVLRLTTWLQKHVPINFLWSEYEDLMGIKPLDWYIAKYLLE